jgi:NTP pyrophosphatase (non-canonical NTP hydrolase)
MPTSPFQKYVSSFVKQNNLEIPVSDRMLDLTSEIGELAKEILKASDYGRQDFQPNKTWNDELGDVFFSLICLANSTNVNLVKELSNALEKYQARLKNTGDAGSDTSNPSLSD